MMVPVLSHREVLKFWTETFWLILSRDRFLQDLSQDFLAEACRRSFLATASDLFTSLKKDSFVGWEDLVAKP